MNSDELSGQIKAYSRVIKFIEQIDPENSSIDFELLKRTLRIWIDVLEKKPIVEDMRELKIFSDEHFPC